MSQSAGRVADATGNWVDSSAPAWARPYLRLTRLDRPIGWWLLLLPCWWSSALAAVANGAWGPDPWHIVLLLIGAIVMRGAGCTWNDLVDRDIDARVERTRSRPIPSGQVSVKAAAVFLVVQALVGLAGAGAVQPLCHRGRHRLARRGGDLSVHEALHLLAADFPRAGVLLGRADGLGRRRAARWSGRRSCSTPGSIAWVIHYDTIYAHQDREDDALVGLEIDRAAVRREHQADAGAVLGRGGDPDRRCRIRRPRRRWCSRSGLRPLRRIWPGRSSASTSTIRTRACGCFAPTATPD